MEVTFSPFSRLPLELRRRIWQLSAEDPRLVTIQLRKEDGRYICLTPIPTILSTCHESRQEGFRIYQNQLRLSSYRIPGSYINHDTDDILISYNLSMWRDYRTDAYLTITGGRQHLERRIITSPINRHRVWSLIHDLNASADGRRLRASSLFFTNTLLELIIAVTADEVNPPMRCAAVAVIFDSRFETRLIRAGTRHPDLDEAREFLRWIGCRYLTFLRFHPAVGRNLHHAVDYLYRADGSFVHVPTEHSLNDSIIRNNDIVGTQMVRHFCSRSRY